MYTEHHTAPRGRRRPLATLALAAAVVLALLPLAACGDDDSAADATATTEATESGPASTVEVTATDYAFATDVDTAAAGPVTIRLVNKGKEGHQVHVARLKGDATAQDFLDTFESEGEPAAQAMLEWAGGVNGVEPGESAEATSVLAPGQYVLLCFIPTPGKGGVAHLMKGMVGSLEVVESTTKAAEPEDGAAIELADYSIAIPEGFAGGPVTVTNAGKEAHEMIVFRFEDGAGIPDLLAWQEAGMSADRPFTYAGGTGTIEPGEKAWTDLDLEPGDYLALCVLTGPGGQQHVAMGMATPFTVAS